MRHRSIAVLAVLALVLGAAAKDVRVVQSFRPANPIQLDGQSADWPAEALQTEKSVASSYAFANDDTNLYVLFVFNDPKFLSSSDRTGITLWVNAEGKEKPAHGLNFRRKTVTADQLIAELEKQGQSLDEAKKAELRKRPQYQIYACDVVDKKAKAVSLPAGSPAATFRIGQPQKRGGPTVYEFVVPLALLNDPASAQPLDTSKPFKLGFQWGGMTEEMMKEAAARIGDRGAEARASAASEDPKSEQEAFNAPGGSLASMRNPRAKKYDFWLDLQIAQNK